MESDEQEFISKTDNIASNESNAGNVNTCPSASPFSDLNEVSRNGLTDDREDGVGFSHKTFSEPSKVREVYLNGSPFVDEDSNQPMPLGLFFENADLMQDLLCLVVLRCAEESSETCILEQRKRRKMMMMMTMLTAWLMKEIFK
ncbi:UPF0688 protein C1orf174 homolog [Xenopus laevis]|uniref:UPF0688 protein C1orf174 homolog n=1 Tax=Xenopus laevis TaxID=8355 RepID=A0A8J1L9M4_XENLA|nr:UPF0688 protein C1orf174 homolog [Xenopus laevis]